MVTWLHGLHGLHGYMGYMGCMVAWAANVNACCELRVAGGTLDFGGMTEPEPLQQIERTYVRIRGRKLSYFSGCDYFRLGSHPEVIAAVREGLQKYGLNVAASRLTTGNHVLYGQLEEKL